MMLRYLGILPAALLLGAGGAALGQTLPWGQSADQVAWETFVQVVAPSGDPTQHRVEFETWASDDDIYATNPPTWPTVGTPKHLQISALARAIHAPQLGLIAPSDCTQNFDKTVAQQENFPLTGCVGEEVRRNWGSFQYIVSNGLYTAAGFAKAFNDKLKVDLPADAVELKGDWVPVADVMKWVNLTEKEVDDQYYTSTATAGSTTTKFALVSFHFSTKQIKDWVWTDFEHAKNPGRCDDIGCHDSFGAVDKDVAPKSTAWQQYGECKKSDALEKMFSNAGISSVWKNYCLKGTQVDFVTSADKPTLLGNSVIEALNASVPIPKSSCISCHAVASFNSSGAPNIPALQTSPTGKVDENLMKGYSANDFIWGVIVAQ
jgi:hypothetical protein